MEEETIALFFWRRARHVTLFSKPGCHLCEETRDQILGLSRLYPLTFEEIDIRSDSVLFRRYDIVIPVVRVDGGPDMEAPISRTDLRSALGRR